MLIHQIFRTVEFTLGGRVVLALHEKFNGSCRIRVYPWWWRGIGNMVGVVGRGQL